MRQLNNSCKTAILRIVFSIFILFFSLILTRPIFANNNIDSLEIELKKANELNKIDILITLSKAYWTIAPSKGILYSNKAIELAEKHNNKNDKAKALLYGGVNMWFMGAYDTSLEYFQKSLTIAREIHNERLCAYNLNNLGMVNTNLKNYEKAINYYSESSLIIKKLDDEIEYAKIKNNIAGLNMHLGNLNKALKQHLYVLKIIENSDEHFFLIWLLNDIGVVYYKKENYKLALQYFYKSLKKSNKTDDNIGKSIIFNSIGEVYLKQKKYEKAKEYFFNGLKYAEETNAKENIKEIYKNISEYYSAINNYKKSLNYYKLYKILSDSIMNENKIHTIVEMQTIYEMESKEKENNLLRKNIEISKLTKKKDNNLHIFSIILLLFTVFMIILIYSKLIMKKQRNKELNEKNFLINKQKNQLSNTLIELQKLNNKLKLQKKEIQTSSEELGVANKQLTELNATKDKFFSIIAHDLKSPFNAILGFSDILLENHNDYNDEERKKIIRLVNNSANSAFSLLENLLTWSRSQSGQVSFSPEKLHLNILLSETMVDLQSQANKKNIQLLETVSENNMIFADKNMIATVFRNLISNAIKFTSKNGTIIIASKKQTDSNFLEISVTDTGVGIPQDKIDDLFRIDKNTSTQGTENEKGTGLGLILCKEFVKKNSGKIWVESEVDIGSKFIFTLPVI